MNSSKRATIKDIARIAGVSTAAVSQALRPRANSNIKLQQATVERVKIVARQLNYRPHSGARSIRSRRFGTLGYLKAKNGLFTHTPAGYMAGVHDVAEKNAFRITLIQLPYEVGDLSSSLPLVFAEHNLDALVIESYSEFSNRIHAALERPDFPVIFLNDRHPYNSVYVNDVLGARLAVRHLVEKGYQKLCFVIRKGPDRDERIEDMHHSLVDRITGFYEELKDQGIEGTLVELKKEVVALEQGADLNDDDWTRLKAFDGIVVYDDDLANMIGRYCFKNGIRLPQEMAMVSFNGDYGSLCAWQRLTTIQMPSYEMGKKAGLLALELIQKGKQESIPSTAYSPRLIVGETT